MDDGKGLAKSHVRYLGVSVGLKTYFRRRTQNIVRLLTCPLCNKIYKEATTINRCNHTFCSDCITEKLQADETKRCSTCQEDLSPFSPDEYQRPDDTLRDMIKNFLGNSPNTAIVRTSQAVTSKVAFAASEPASKEEVTEIDEKFGEQTKKSATIIEAGQFCSDQGKDEEVKQNNELEGAPPKINSEVFYKYFVSKENNDEDSAKDELLGEHGKKLSSVWFHLVPEEDKAEHAHPKLKSSYIHIKNGDLPASMINKLLAKKINLESEDEVEVCCLGIPLVGSLSLRSIRDMWIESITSIPNYMIFSGKAEELDAKIFVMELTYRKTKKHEVPKLN